MISTFTLRSIVCISSKMVYARLFGKSLTNLYTYPNSCSVAGSHPRLRRLVLEADESLNRICFFLLHWSMLCLLLFWVRFCFSSFYFRVTEIVSNIDLRIESETGLHNNGSKNLESGIRTNEQYRFSPVSVLPGTMLSPNFSLISTVILNQHKKVIITHPR